MGGGGGEEGSAYMWENVGDTISAPHVGNPARVLFPYRTTQIVLHGYDINNGFALWCP